MGQNTLTPGVGVEFLVNETALSFPPSRRTCPCITVATMSQASPLSQPQPDPTFPEPQPDQSLFFCRNCGSTFPESHSSCPACNWHEPPRARVKHSVPKLEYKAHDIALRSATSLDIHELEVQQAACCGVLPPSYDLELFSTCTVGGLSIQVYEPAPECIKYTVPSSFLSAFVWFDEETGKLTCDHPTANDSIISFLQKCQQEVPANHSDKFPCQIAVAFTGVDLRYRDDCAVILTKKCKCQCPGCPTRFFVHLTAWADHLFSVNGLAELCVQFSE